MPRKYTRRPAKKSRKPRKSTRITRKALTGKIDTAIEKRMQQIAKKEADKNVTRLIDRNYYWGACDPSSNHWSGGKRIFFDGVIQQIAKIDKADINQPLNAPDADPQEAVGFQENDFDGMAQGHMTETIHGRRLTDLIKITGFSYAMKLFADRTPAEHNVSLVGNNQNSPNNAGNAIWHEWFEREASGEYARYFPETVKLDYAIVQVFDSDTVAGASTPTVNSLLPYRRWGYSAKLDDVEKNETLFLKKRVLHKGSLSYQVREQVHRDKTISKYVKLPRPLTIKYQPQDQNGEAPVNSRLYFVIRSNVPCRTGTQLLDYSPFAPKCSLVFKTYYQE